MAPTPDPPVGPPNASSTDGEVHSATVARIVSLSQAAYDALAVKDSNTLYVIV